MAKGKKSRSKLGQKKATKSKSTTRSTRKGVAQNKGAKSKKPAHRLPDTVTDASGRL